MSIAGYSLTIYDKSGVELGTFSHIQQLLVITIYRSDRVLIDTVSSKSA